MKKLSIDADYLKTTLLELLAIPSPSGLTDEIVHYAVGKLQDLGIESELTRRGTIRALMKGTQSAPDRAIVAHLDTLGAMVSEIKNNGRCALSPIGTWSSRFAEGARVSVFTEHGRYRGTILPLLSSGHAFNDAIDTQPVAWSQLELRIDEDVTTAIDLRNIGVQVGDFVAVDPQPEILDNGYVVSRHIDNKGAVAAFFAALKAVKENDIVLPLDCHPVFTLTEEVGSGATAVLHEDVSEVIGIDVAPSAAGQETKEYGVTIPMKDSAGPHDYHLTRHMISLCRQFEIPFQRDVFKFYHSDAGSAVMAGHDVRTALLCVGTDSTHGYERTHMRTLVSLAELLVLYMQSPSVLARDKNTRAGIEGFSHQLPERDLQPINQELPNPIEWFTKHEKE